MRHALLALAALLFVTEVAEAQIWRRARRAAERGVERAVERQVENRTRQAAEAAIDAMFDGAEAAVRCVFTDETCIRDAQERGEDVVLTDADGAPVDRNGDPVGGDNANDAVVRAPSGSSASAPAGPSSPGRAGEGVWANYDFVPGARVLFYDDFSDDYVGNFPRRLGYVRGNMEVVEWEGRTLMRGTAGDAFTIELAEALPDRFTIEFDAHDPATESGMSIFFVDPEGYDGDYINIGNWRGSGVWRERGPLAVEPGVGLEQAIVPIRIAVDGEYAKVYAGENRIANVPTADLGRSRTITFVMRNREDRPYYLGDVRVAAGGREMLYDQLQAEGRVATRGVLFDTGSDRIQPESTPTLLDIARMMERHGDLRLRVEGHTDNTGASAANQTLSQRRAEAVVAFLTGRGIDASRLEAAGLGDAQPAADNATPEGRQQNRRVELVRL